MTSDQRGTAAIVAGVVATAGIGAVASDPNSDWYRRLDQPSWAPPDAAFGPVWTTLYALMAWAFSTVWRRTPDAERPRFAVLVGSNLVLNLLWTVIFFRGRSPLAAGIEIVVLEGTTVALIALAWPRSRAAAIALVPYALWVAFATALTWAIFAPN